MNDTVHAMTTIGAVTSAFGLTDCGSMTLEGVARALSKGTGCNDTLTVTYTVKDACGNSVELYQKQRVNDSLAPAYTNQTIYAAATACVNDTLHAMTTIGDVTSAFGLTDCSTMTLEDVSRSLKVGTGCKDTLTVTYTVKDACGNSVVLYQKQRVNDSLAPEYTNQT